MTQAQFNYENTQDWNAILLSIFGDHIPSEYRWTKKNEIITVLNKIGSGNSTNYTFFPDGGGLTLEGACLSRETGCIELDFDSSHIIKINSLSFTAIGFDPGCSYFTLETATLKPVSLSKSSMVQRNHEYLVELIPGKYIDGKYWDYGVYNNHVLPSSARPVYRIIKGDLVIFSKSSVYNQITNTDDGRHTQMDREAFSQYVSEMYLASLSVPKVSA